MHAISAPFVRAALPLVACVLLGTVPCLAAATLTQQVDPPEANIGDQVNITFTLQNGSVSNIQLPRVDGLQVLGSRSATNITVTNGAFQSSVSQTFVVTPSHAGDFTIPAFDIHTQDGQNLRTQPINLHVLSDSTAAPPANSPAPPSGNGPVTMPPATANGPATNGNPADGSGANANIPTESDGRPAKVFILITPKTTDAYVGETIPLRIEFYLRRDVLAQQDSLPTIKGSDFLMNDLSVRAQQDEVAVMNEDFLRETWVTAISAPKSGDFPLQMERDTYWTKPSPSNFMDPFGGIFGPRPQLAHAPIPSNQFVIHVHALPDEGRPDNFSGAIGQFKVTGNSEPDAVAVGDPVTLHFTVSGEGNFNYVRCPTLAPDPNWKTYVPSGKTTFNDESRTQGTKTFEQAIIPQKNGGLPIPAASFSYFDASTKQYVTIPINLPLVQVTGSAASASSAPSAAADSTSTSTEPAKNDFAPNRVDLGMLYTSLTPLYRQSWFWVVQGALILVLVAGVFLILFRTRSQPDLAAAERARRERSLHQEEDAMGTAAREGDSQAFFLAARHAIQLRLGNQWQLRPEAITLAEVRQRDPQLAETVEPLFAKADEVIYSGATVGRLDLAEWDRRVRELLQLQTA